MDLGLTDQEITHISDLLPFHFPQAGVQFSLCVRLMVVTSQQECEAAGRKIWILLPSLLHDAHMLGAVCVSLCNATYKWKAENH